MKCCHRSTTWRGRLALAIPLALCGLAARPAAPVDAADEPVGRAIAVAIRDRMGAGADVAVDRVWLSAALPSGVTELTATPEPGSRLGRPIRFSLSRRILPGDSRGSGAGYAVADLTVHADHTRAARAVSRGAELTVDAVVASREAIRSAWLKRLPLPGEVVGARAARDLAPDEIVEGTMIAAQSLVRSGQLVSVRSVIGLIDVRGRAKASQQGTLGDIIRLVNPDSGRVLRGRVVGNGEVEVIP